MMWERWPIFVHNAWPKLGCLATISEPVLCCKYLSANGENNYGRGSQGARRVLEVFTMTDKQTKKRLKFNQARET